MVAHTLTEVELIARMTRFEDALVERKSSKDSKDWLKTIVAFANSVPIDSEPGVLFIGIKDNGDVEPGLTDYDSLQKTLNEKVKSAYPAVQYTSRVLQQNGKSFLAVIVPGSPDRPHFAGPAFVRVGSTTQVASKPLFDGLVAERNSKTYEIRRYLGKNVLVVWMNSGPAVRRLGPEAGWKEMTVVDCDQFRVTLEGWGSTQILPLSRVDISTDFQGGRLRLEIREP